MAAFPLPTFVDPFVIKRVAISPSGANQITIVTFPGLPQGAVVSMVPANDMQITHKGAELATIDDEFAFPVFAGGINELPAAGWGSRKNAPADVTDPYIRMASSVQGAVCRFLVTRLPS